MGTFSKGVLLDQVVPVSLSLNLRLWFDLHFSAAHRTDYFKPRTPDRLDYANNNRSRVYSTAESTYSFLLLGFETDFQISEAGLELLILLSLSPDTRIIGL